MKLADIVMMTAVVLASLHTCAAVSCYVCDTMSGNSSNTCIDDFDPNHYALSIAENCGYCGKFKIKGDEGQIVYRTCSPVRTHKDCKGDDEEGLDWNMCFCKDDLCNHASAQRFSMATIMLFIVTRIMSC